MNKYISVQCCKCLKILGVEFKNRAFLKDIYCMKCAIEENKIKEGKFIQGEKDVQ